MGLSRGLAQGPGQASSVGCDAQTSAPSTDPRSSPTPHGIPQGDHWCARLLQVGSSCCSPHPEPSLGLSPASDTESCLPRRGPGPLRRCSRPVAARGCARSTERHQNGPFCSARGVWPPGGAGRSLERGARQNFPRPSGHSGQSCCHLCLSLRGRQGPESTRRQAGCGRVLTGDASTGFLPGFARRSPCVGKEAGGEGSPPPCGPHRKQCPEP